VKKIETFDVTLSVDDIPVELNGGRTDGLDSIQLHQRAGKEVTSLNDVWIGQRVSRRVDPL
jgi:hypothetical protein